MTKVENKYAIVSEQEGSSINTALEFISDPTLNEKNVDSLVHALLRKLGFSGQEAILDVSKLNKNKTKIPSKTKKALGPGKIDCAVFIDGDLKVIIEDKAPQEPVDKALEEAIMYADGLNAKGEDVRVVIGFNGLDIKVRVRDYSINEWVPFFIEGSELKAFFGKPLLDIIYSNKNIHGIKIEKNVQGINIQSITTKLKDIYRQNFLETSQKNIDFTIAFIGLRSVFEKYKNKHNLKTWEDLNKRPNANDNDKNDDEDLKNNIVSAVVKILDKIGNEYTDLFISRDSEQNETFNFKTILESLKDENKLKNLREVYLQISKLHNLHDSKIDLFGEVYEALGDKNTKKAFGQYFTRRHIIKSLIDLMEIDVNTFIGPLEQTVENGHLIYTAKSPKTICDPACGTGGFLTEFFKHIQYKAFQKSEYKDLNLSKLSAQSFYGYDVYSANITRTKINMYLAGDGFSEIRKADTLRDDKIKQDRNKFDYIITNPPYGKGDTTVNFPFNESSKTGELTVINSQRLEINFLIKIVDMLKPTGKAMVIIPDGILEATTLSPLREWFLRYCKLEKIISLPKHAFAPYTHEKTYAIFFEKRTTPLECISLIEHDPDVWMYIVDNDGYANSDKRFRTDRVDENGRYLHDEFSAWKGQDGRINNSLIIERFKRKNQGAGEEFFDEWGEKIEGKKYGNIKMSDILKDEFISYNTVAIKDVLNKINEKIRLNLNPDALLTALFSNVEKNTLSIEQQNTLEQIKVELEKEYNIYNLNGIWRHKADNQSKITDGGGLPVKNVDAKFKAIFTKYFLKNSISEIVDERTNMLKEDCEGYIESEGLEYDGFKRIFMDKLKPNIRKTLILTPEKYFRNKKLIVPKFDSEKTFFMSDLFHITSGLRITQEEVYQNPGNIPVITSQTSNNGIAWRADERWLRKFKKNGKSLIITEECISWTKEGNAGKMFFRDHVFFPIDVAGVLVPKKNVPINLSWFVAMFQEYIYTKVTSQGGQGKLYEEQMANIEINLPVIKGTDTIDLDLQNEMYSSINNLLDKI